MADLIVLYEHPEWQKPLFAALEASGIAFEAFDLTRAAFSNTDPPRARLYFNQASPSAYVRGNTSGACQKRWPPNASHSAPDVLPI